MLQTEKRIYRIWFYYTYQPKLQWEQFSFECNNSGYGHRFNFNGINGNGIAMVMESR